MLPKEKGPWDLATIISGLSARFDNSVARSVIPNLSLIVTPLWFIYLSKHCVAFIRKTFILKCR